jgi:arabinan endo-1,5-alpha-L-arabinosidase
VDGKFTVYFTARA